MSETARRRYLEALGLRDFLREAPPTPTVGRQTVSPSSPALGEAPAQTPARVPNADGPRAGGRASAPPPAPEAQPAPEPIPAFDTLEELRACVAECQRCALATTRTQTVFGVGAATAPLMVVGEGPGAEEDRRGEPFVGRAGQLLDAMLSAIGHSRAENAYIANVVKCRPPNNRDPQPAEAEACRGFLDAQIRLLQPRLILAVGRVAAQRLLSTEEPLARLRGQLHHYGESGVPVWVSYHPAYLLRSPGEKAKAWEDLKRVHALLAGEGDGAGN